MSSRTTALNHMYEYVLMGNGIRLKTNPHHFRPVPGSRSAHSSLPAPNTTHTQMSVAQVHTGTHTHARTRTHMNTVQIISQT